VPPTQHYNNQRCELTKASELVFTKLRMIVTWLGVPYNKVTMTFKRAFVVKAH